MRRLSFDVRPIGEADLVPWRDLWAEYSEFYGVEVPEPATSRTWTRLLDPDSSVYGWVAEDGAGLHGFAIAVVHEATWSSRPTCYLEDLFVRESQRGAGTGRALIDEVMRTARMMSMSSVYWHTRADNARARRLYDTYAEADGYVRYRVEIPGARATPYERMPRHQSKAAKAPIRIEPISTFLENQNMTASVAVRHGDTVFISGLPPFDPSSGEINRQPIELQARLVMDQLKLCLEAVGSSPGHALRCNVYCTSAVRFPLVNGIFRSYFLGDPPAATFVRVAQSAEPFDITIDCVAAIPDKE